MSYRPFLVADRPSALRIIRGAMPDFSANGLGIMTHANITDNVSDFIKSFPSSGGFYDRHDSFELDDESNYINPDGSLTKTGKRIQNRTTMICDSGAFQKEGSPFESYQELFAKYQDLDVDLGIINDVLNDTEATLTEAAEAMDCYSASDYQFELVGVAQGTTISEYVECYESLRELGYEKIAVGGLLSKTGDRSGKFAQVSDTAFMERILSAIRDRYPDAWLFALGCHHPFRHHLFESLELAGADYKGWLFKYTQQYVDRKAAREWRFRELRSFLRQNIFPAGIGDPAPRLLILPFGDTEFGTDGLVPAHKRVSGAYMRAVDRWQHHAQPDDPNVDIRFLSPSHGLLPPSFVVPSALGEHPSRLPDQPDVTLRAEFANLLRYRKYDRIFVAGSQSIQELCDPVRVMTHLDSASTTDVTFATGRFPRQRNQLRDWLEASSDTSGNFAVSPQVK